MTVNNRKCIEVLKENTSLIDLYAIIILALLNLPKKKQLSKISLKKNNL